MNRRSRVAAVCCAMALAVSCGSPDDAGLPAGTGDASAAEAVAGAGGSGGEIARTQVAVGDFTFDVRMAGPVDGEVVILLHGFPQTSYEWRHQLRALGEAGFRAVAPDQRGYSPGAAPARRRGLRAAAARRGRHRPGRTPSGPTGSTSPVMTGARPSRGWSRSSPGIASSRRTRCRSRTRNAFRRGAERPDVVPGRSVVLLRSVRPSRIRKMASSPTIRRRCAASSLASTPRRSRSTCACSGRRRRSAPR